MSATFLLRGMLIGMFVALPVGPLGLLSLQRTINKGWKVGFVSGVGAAASDLIYSSIAILGVSFIDEFLEKHMNFIDSSVGILFLIIGTSIIFNAIKDKKAKNDVVKGEEKKEENKEENMIYPFASNFLMGLSNPITLLVFLAIFTKLGIEVNVEEIFKNIAFVISIFSGSSLLWLCITNLVKNFDTKKIDGILYVDETIGAIIIIFGIVSILKGIS
ncbi:hypothetical protein GOM49_05540 [Clostridium bovifaecis]|uniref:Lysine transporter LysE n=1 Tax=Clostridium bovifaecis TaxID=2184719 RepID=A0A6I6EUS7_9CLOT|nr:hypothetical protein GOM49_05540 [Clostridium bovifaecis]